MVCLFADNAVNTIKETKALLKDAADNNYEYTTADEDYNKLVEQAESAAAAASLDEKDIISRTLVIMLPRRI